MTHPHPSEGSATPRVLPILVGCEASGAVRRALDAKGIDSRSCDVLPAEDRSNRHIQDDLRSHLHDRWAGVIAFPTCTYITCAAEWAYGYGPYHQKVKPDTLTGAARRAAREEAIEFVLTIWNAPVPFVVIENPVGVLSRVLGKPTCTVQPHQHGHDASKRTCFWTRGDLPPLEPTKIIAPRMVDGKPRWANQTDSGQNRLSPGPDRWKERSRTYEGIAAAIADQWGSRIAA